MRRATRNVNVQQGMVSSTAVMAMTVAKNHRCLKCLNHVTVVLLIIMMRLIIITSFYPRKKSVSILLALFSAKEGLGALPRGLVFLHCVWRGEYASNAS